MLLCSAHRVCQSVTLCILPWFSLRQSLDLGACEDWGLWANQVQTNIKMHLFAWPFFEFWSSNPTSVPKWTNRCSFSVVWRRGNLLGIKFRYHIVKLAWLFLLQWVWRLYFVKLLMSRFVNHWDVVRFRWLSSLFFLKRFFLLNVDRHYMTRKQLLFIVVRWLINLKEWILVFLCIRFQHCFVKQGFLVVDLVFVLIVSDTFL